MTRNIICRLFLLLLLLPVCSIAQIKLEKRSLLNDKIELLVPDNFKPMTSYAITQKYPNSGQPPNLALTDEKSDVDLIIVLTPQFIQPSQMGQFKDFMIRTLKRGHPDAKWLDNGVRTVNGKNVGYFKLVTNAADQKKFVYYFFTDMDGKVLMFTFNCTESLLPKWKNTAEAIVASLKVK